MVRDSGCPSVRKSSALTAVASMLLPDSPRAPSSMSSFHSTASCRAIRVVLVEDEAAFRESLAEMLRDDGHEVLAYAEPASIPPFDSLGRVDLLLTDYDMPGKNGLVLADELHAHRPSVPVLLATAHR